MPAKTDSPKPLQISVPVTIALDEQLRERAFLERRTRPAVVRSALEKYLAESAA